jgi:hypothetical protein
LDFFSLEGSSRFPRVRWVELPSMAMGKLIIERLRRQEFLSGDAPKRPFEA